MNDGEISCKTFQWEADWIKRVWKITPILQRLTDHRHWKWKMLREKPVCSLEERVKDRVRVRDGCCIHSLVIKNILLTFNIDILKQLWHNSCIKSALSKCPAFLWEKGPLQVKLALRMTMGICFERLGIEQRPIIRKPTR